MIVQFKQQKIDGYGRSRLAKYLLCGLLLTSAPNLTFSASLFPTDPFGTLEQVPPDQGSQWNMSGSACSKQPEPDKPWTLVDVINRALCENPQTRETWANARQQAAQLGVTKAQLLPNADLNGNLSRSYNSRGSTAISSTGNVVRVPAGQNQSNAAMSLNYLLFDFGARSAAVEGTRQSLLAADWTHNATLQNVMLSAIQAYYQSFATQESVKATQTSEKSAQEAFDAARFRHQVGAAALADELQARTAYSQARLNRQQAEGNASIAVGTLANVVGLEADAPLKLAPPILMEPTIEEKRTVKELIEVAKADRPDLAAAEAQVNAAQAAVRQAKAGGLPTFPLFANYGDNYSQGFGNYRTWSIGVSINVPLFTGYSDTYKIRAAQASLESSVAAQNLLTKRISLDVWSAYHNLQTAYNTFVSSTDLLASSAEAERVALGRYKVGVGTILDLLNAEANLANARLQHIQAQYNWYTSRAALAQAIGRLQPESIVATPVKENK